MINEKDCDINTMINKIKEARPGTYLLRDNEVESAIFIANTEGMELLTNKTISIDTESDKPTIIIEYLKQYENKFLD